jgi:tape measure domain-containing protein
MAEKTVYIIDLNDKVTPKLKTVQGEAKKTDSAFKGISSSLSGMGGMIAGAFSIGALASFGSQIIQTTAKFQSLSNSIKFASDSAQQGELSMHWLSNLAKTYGLPITELTEGFKTFQGAMMKTKFTSNEVRTMFAQVSTGVTAMGLSSEDAKGTFLALGQIMGKGKVQAEELRGQIGERIPGAFAIAARSMGMTTAELDKFMADGKLMSEDFLPKFAAEMEKTFGEGAMGNVDSLTATMTRASSAWTEMMLAIGNSDSEGLIGKAFNMWAGLLDRIADGFRDIDGIVKNNTSDTVRNKLATIEEHYKSQGEFMSKEDITANFQKSEGLRGQELDKKIEGIKWEMQRFAEKGPEEGGFGGKGLFGEHIGATEKEVYGQGGEYAKLKDELAVMEQIRSASMGVMDKVVSSLYSPSNAIVGKAGKVSKTKGSDTGGLNLNESKNGATNITFNIDTFQKNEFTKDGSTLTGQTVQNILKDMALALLTVQNDSQIVARQ